MGRQGRNGAIGVPGTPGPMGPRGGAGRNGENGLDGENGAPGVAGVPGKNGEYCICPKKEKKGKKNAMQIEKSELDTAIQSLVESSPIKMEAPEAPHESSTDGYSDSVQISPSSSGVDAAPPAVEPASMTATYDEQVVSEASTTEEQSSSLSPSYEIMAAIEVAESTISTTTAHVSSVDGTSEFQGQSVSSTAPPAFSPKSFEVTQIYHRGTGGGRTIDQHTTTPTTSVPASKFVRHVGGWSRRASPPHPPPVRGSKKHDTDTHLQRRAFGGARAVS
ncbi:hypothetical protein PRIPAC_88716 [Pristionchus pacificus]|nr:hypothetical protein PRIPAC_88716 [Pristionchus pacificus]